MWAFHLGDGSLYSITIIEGTEDNISFYCYLLPLELENGAGGYLLCLCSPEHSCSETSVCVKLVTFKIQNVDFQAPPSPSTLTAITLGSPDADVPLKRIANNNSACISVQCFSFSFYSRNPVSP